jgi:hypothetical protein
MPNKQLHKILKLNYYHPLYQKRQVSIILHRYLSKTVLHSETIYKILIQTGAYQGVGNDSNLYLTIFGQNGQTKKLPLNKTTKTNKKVAFKTDDKIEFELKTNDVGKVSLL